MIKFARVSFVLILCLLAGGAELSAQSSNFKLGKNLDIQYVVRGHERIKWSPIKGMDVKTPYNEETDATFYEHPSPYGGEIIIGNGNFSIMFPQDGHAPCISQEKELKKAIFKVKC